MAVASAGLILLDDVSTSERMSICREDVKIYETKREHQKIKNKISEICNKKQ